MMQTIAAPAFTALTPAAAPPLPHLQVHVQSAGRLGEAHGTLLRQHSRQALLPLDAAMRKQGVAVGCSSSDGLLQDCRPSDLCRAHNRMQQAASQMHCCSTQASAQRRSRAGLHHQ